MTAKTKTRWPRPQRFRYPLSVVVDNLRRAAECFERQDHREMTAHLYSLRAAVTEAINMFDPEREVLRMVEKAGQKRWGRREWNRA